MSSVPFSNPPKVAVIGSGLAGLSASWLMTLRGFEVHLFEKSQLLGLGSHSTDVGDHGEVIDVPARTFVDGFYTQMIELFRCIGIETAVASTSPTIQVFGNDAHFRLSNVILQGSAIPYVNPWSFIKHLSSYWNIFTDMWYFKKAALKVQQDEDFRRSLSQTTLAEYITKMKYSTDFADNFLIPCFSVIGTCSCWDVKNYPVTVVMDFMVTMFMTGKTTHRMANGTRNVSQLLVKNVAKVYCNTHVESVTSLYTSNGQVAGVEVKINGNEPELFDHVVVATQANQALQILSNPHPQQAEALKRFQYVWSEVIVHTDKRLMPKDKHDWSNYNVFIEPKNPSVHDDKTTGLNYEPSHITAEHNHKTLPDCTAGGAVMCTLWHNRTHNLKFKNDQENLFQTWNPWIKPRPDRVLPNGYHYFERPIVTVASQESQKMLAQTQGIGNIWFCGAYSLPGVPLLENAVDSGLLIAEHLTGTLRPWKQKIKPQAASTQLWRKRDYLLTLFILTLIVLFLYLIINVLDVTF